MNKYKTFIGIEIHAELDTKSKMFCGCKAFHFNVKPNTHTCPVCLGLPGALPVPNKKAVDWTQLIGAALGCSLATESKFDRKHYFYPDLPKGYQISQYDKPLCFKGKLNDIRITRVHLEEDTGKLIHTKIKNKDASLPARQVSLVDFNRSGVPLVEIVSEPDIHDAAQAVNYVKSIQQILRYLAVSDCDMEKGSMRLEANISVSKNNNLPKYKVEVKNLNSFRFLKNAIEYEVKRQTKLLEKSQTPDQETRGWDQSKNKTYTQRSKEEAADYRYFPEPDIPPMQFTHQEIEKIKTTIPELPLQKLERFISQYNLSKDSVRILTKNTNSAEYFEKAAKIALSKNIKPQTIANAIVNKKFNIKKLTPKLLINAIHSKSASQVSDTKQLTTWVKQVIKQNPKAIKDIKASKPQAIGFLIGQVQGLARGQADPNLTKKIIQDNV